MRESRVRALLEYSQATQKPRSFAIHDRSLACQTLRATPRMHLLETLNTQHNIQH